MALSRLGASTIVSITQDTSEAILCNTFFDDLADEVMLEGSWTSTIKRASLAKTTNTPAYEFASEFQLPVDPFCLKVIDIDQDSTGLVPYQIEGDKLLTDSGSMKIRYIGRLTDTEDWDALLRQAFTARLASELAYAITGDQRRTEFELERYSRLVQQGLALNGQQGSKKTLATGEFIEVR